MDLSKHNVSGILFDLDGTLIDPFRALDHALFAIFDKYGHQYDSSRGMQTLGRSMKELFAEIAGPENVDRLVDEFWASYETVNTDTKMVFVLPGVIEMLETLREHRIPVGVATNKQGTVARRELTEMGLTPYVELCVGVGDRYRNKPFRAKPEADMLLFLADQMGLVPDKTLYVGDTDVDIAAARSARMHSVGVGPNMSRVSSAENVPVFILPSSAHLPVILHEHLQRSQKGLSKPVFSLDRER